MKKVITICLLVITFFAGGMTIGAKTTNKKTKTRTSKTIYNISFNLKSILNLYDKLNFMSSLNAIQDDLDREVAKFGFEPDMEYETEYQMESPDGETWMEDAMHFAYFKDETYINFTILYYKENRKHLQEITITFPSTKDLNSFITASQSSLGKSLKKYDNNFYSYHNWGLKKDGEVLTITWNEEE